jgi:hypothetical protein
VYDAADVELDSPVVRTLGNATPALQGILAGTISSAVFPSSGLPYNGTIFCVYRLTNTAENDGLGAGNRGISFTDASSQAQTRLHFNDGVFVASPATYLAVYSAQVGGSTVSAAFGGGITTSPRAVVGCVAGRTETFQHTTDVYGDEWITTSTQKHNGSPTGVGVSVGIGSVAAQPQGSVTFAFLAFFPRSLSRAEQAQLIDAARNEWPLAY